MEWPLISVIVPIYNVEDYLSVCVESICQQTYSNLEIILVDDGSTDSCPTICDEYGKIDDRIIVIHQANGGLSAARNKGLSVATGEYVAFVDSDDWISRNMYAVMMQALLKTGLNIVQVKHTESYGREVEFDYSPTLKYKVIDSKKALHGLYGREFIDYIVVWNKLYKKSLFDNITFPVGKINEDEFINYKLFWNESQIVILPYRLHCYRQRPNSIMSQGFNVRKLDGLEALEERIRFFDNQKEKTLRIKTIGYYNEKIFDLYEDAKRKGAKKSLLFDLYRRLFRYAMPYLLSSVSDNQKKRMLMCFLLERQR